MEVLLGIWCPFEVKNLVILSSRDELFECMVGWLDLSNYPVLEITTCVQLKGRITGEFRILVRASLE